MAPTHNAVVVHSANLDVELAENAAASLARSQPDKTPKQIVNDLLERLQKLRLRRELKGLNHWPEFAPDYLQKLLVRHAVHRRRVLDEFFRTERESALARAEVMLGNRWEAEDAVTVTFRKVLSGKAAPANFYRALKQTCLDRIRARKREAKLFVPECAMRSRAATEVDWNPDGREASAEECAWDSHSGDDPLEILIQQEDQEEFLRQLEQAKKDPRWRFFKRKKWAAPLQKDVPN